jgi:cell division protein FtsL
MARPEGSFVRWQQIRIAQFGFAVNLLMTLSAASLGFALTQVRDKSITCQWSSKVFLVTSVALLLVSLCFGIICTTTRLYDFRKTAKIARVREKMKQRNKNQDMIRAKLQAARSHVRTIGRWTWRLFWYQMVAFSIGAIALAVAFGIAYWSRLFSN